METLPNDVLRLICVSVDLPDLGRLFRTCRRLSSLFRDPLIWRSKLLQDYPMFSGPSPSGTPDYETMSPEESEHCRVRFREIYRRILSNDLEKDLRRIAYLYPENDRETFCSLKNIDRFFRMSTKNTYSHDVVMTLNPRNDYQQIISLMGKVKSRRRISSVVGTSIQSIFNLSVVGGFLVISIILIEILIVKLGLNISLFIYERSFNQTAPPLSSLI